MVLRQRLSKTRSLQTVFWHAEYMSQLTPTRTSYGSQTTVVEDKKSSELRCSNRPSFTAIEQNSLYCSLIETSLKIQGYTALTPQVYKITKRASSLAGSCICLICHTTIHNFEYLSLYYENGVVCIFQIDKVFTSSYLNTRALKISELSSQYLVDHEIKWGPRFRRTRRSASSELSGLPFCALFPHQIHVREGADTDLATQFAHADFTHRVRTGKFAVRETISVISWSTICQSVGQLQRDRTLSRCNGSCTSGPVSYTEEFHFDTHRVSHTSDAEAVTVGYTWAGIVSSHTVDVSILGWINVGGCLDTVGLAISVKESQESTLVPAATASITGKWKCAGDTVKSCMRWHVQSFRQLSSTGLGGKSSARQTVFWHAEYMSQLTPTRTSYGSQTTVVEDKKSSELRCSNRPSFTAIEQNSLYCSLIETSLKIQGYTALTPQHQERLVGPSAKIVASWLDSPHQIHVREGADTDLATQFAHADFTHRVRTGKFAVRETISVISWSTICQSVGQLQRDRTLSRCNGSCTSGPVSYTEEFHFDTHRVSHTRLVILSVHAHREARWFLEAEQMDNEKNAENICKLSHLICSNGPRKHFVSDTIMDENCFLISSKGESLGRWEQYLEQEFSWPSSASNLDCRPSTSKGSSLSAVRTAYLSYSGRSCQFRSPMIWGGERQTQEELCRLHTPRSTSTPQALKADTTNAGLIYSHLWINIAITGDLEYLEGGTSLGLVVQRNTELRNYMADASSDRANLGMIHGFVSPDSRSTCASKAIIHVFLVTATLCEQPAHIPLCDSLGQCRRVFFVRHHTSTAPKNGLCTHNQGWLLPNPSTVAVGLQLTGTSFAPHTRSRAQLRAFDGLRKRMIQLADKLEGLESIRSTAIIKQSIVQGQILLRRGAKSTIDGLSSMVQDAASQPKWRSKGHRFVCFVTCLLAAVTADVRRIAHHITSAVVIVNLTRCAVMFPSLVPKDAKRPMNTPHEEGHASPDRTYLLIKTTNKVCIFIWSNLELLPGGRGRARSGQLIRNREFPGARWSCASVWFIQLSAMIEPPVSRVSARFVQPSAMINDMVVLAYLAAYAGAFCCLTTNIYKSYVLRTWQDLFGDNEYGFHDVKSESQLSRLLNTSSAAAVHSKGTSKTGVALLFKFSVRSNKTASARIRRLSVNNRRRKVIPRSNCLKLGKNFAQYKCAL
ncbi:hypothetical protein CLF_108603 [Clonorchis sinensis]|uniref:Uncharacterized protein n=1 Tax=Clonorchis sinensis TaxID=79923 RepID=G7YI95_CLOSI|nr:hypothetical protein CLF_108603 [Clonorchis sinensis]